MTVITFNSMGFGLRPLNKSLESFTVYGVVSEKGPHSSLAFKRDFVEVTEKKESASEFQLIAPRQSVQKD